MQKQILFIALLVLTFLGISNPLTAQITGIVFDESLQPLPYASVYIDQTSKGTSSNAQGEFLIRDTPDTPFVLVIKYLGYKTVRIDIDQISTNKITAHLELENIELQTLIVSSGGEDPAYAMIRNAINKRTAYLNQYNAYKASSYVKGKITLDSIPAFLYKSLDTTLQKTLEDLKTLYLSETISDYYYTHPDQEREVIHSSQVSGDPRGFSFNQAVGLRINPYKKGIQLENNIVSPIAPNAFNYYRFEWVGAFFEEDHLINKIKLIPKNSSLPAFSGHLYLIENSWNIYACDFSLDGIRYGNELIDQINFKLDYIESSPGSWVLYNQTLTFSANVMGIQFSGLFAAIFTNYSFESAMPENMFKRNEKVIMLSDANTKELSYWEQTRPIPLETDEDKDYKAKDSLNQIYTSPEYKDSLQLIGNKYNSSSLSLGYTYKNWRKNFELGHSPLLDNSNYNPIQGISLGTKLFFNYFRNQYKLSIYNEVNYGIEDKRLLSVMGIKINKTGQQNQNFTVEGGSRYLNFNPTFATQNFESNFYNTFFSRNFERLFRKDYLQIEFNSASSPQFRYSFSLEGGYRSQLFNQINNSYLKTKNNFADNLVPIRENSSVGFQNHSFVKTKVRLNFFPFMKYKTMPDRYINLGTSWPKLTLEYNVWRTEVSKALHQNIQFEIEKGNIDFRTVGYSQFIFKTGFFIQSNSLQLPDVHFLNGNEAIFKLNSNRLDFFRALPNYSYSEKYFATLHWEHHFMGWIINRLPLIRKTGFKSTVALRAAKTEAIKYYLEPCIGIENIGWKYIRPLKIEYVPMTLQENGVGSAMWIVGFNLTLR